MFYKKTLAAVLLLTAIGTAFYGGLRSDRALRITMAQMAANADDAALAEFPNASASSDPNVGVEADLSPLQLVWRVLTIVKDHFVDEVDPFNNTKMARGAVRYMVASLGDSNSRFLEPQDVTNISKAAKGEFEGIGAVVRIAEKKMADYTDQQLTVVAALPGSPAAKAGIMTGDVVEEVGSKWVMSHDPFVGAYKVAKDFAATTSDKKKAYKDAEDLRKRAVTLDDAARELSTGTSGELELKLRRAGKPVTVKVPLGRTAPDPVEYRKLPGSVAYIRLNLISEDTVKDFGKAAEKALSDGATGLVLDLRGTPGGASKVVSDIAGYFMPGGRIAYLYRPKGPKQELKASSEPGSASKLRVVALVNGGTEGTSEMLAGALRDNVKARLVGESTWGNSFERTVFSLNDGSGYVLTTGKYLTPKGGNYNKTGLKPDAVVPMSPALVGSDKDTQLERAAAAARRQAV